MFKFLEWIFFKQPTIEEKAEEIKVDKVVYTETVRKKSSSEDDDTSYINKPKDGSSYISYDHGQMYQAGAGWNLGNPYR